MTRNSHLCCAAFTDCCIIQRSGSKGLQREGLTIVAFTDGCVVQSLLGGVGLAWGPANENQRQNTGIKKGFTPCTHSGCQLVLVSMVTGTTYIDICMGMGTCGCGCGLDFGNPCQYPYPWCGFGSCTHGYIVHLLLVHMYIFTMLVASVHIKQYTVV